MFIGTGSFQGLEGDLVCVCPSLLSLFQAGCDLPFLVLTPWRWLRVSPWGRGWQRRPRWGWDGDEGPGGVTRAGWTAMDNPCREESCRGQGVFTAELLN